MSSTTVRDAFGRTLASGWGSADTGEAWSTIGAGGSVLAADWSVGGGVGVHSVPVALAYRASYLPTFAAADVTVSVTASVTALPTGGPLELANLMLRGTDITTYYLARAQVETSGVVTASIYAPGGAQLGVATTGVTYTPGMRLRVTAMAVGRTLRIRVSNAAVAEPAAWTLIVVDGTYIGAGWVGVRNGVPNTNTNPKPVVFSVDDFTASVAALTPFPTAPIDVTIEFAFGADLKADPATWVYTDCTGDWQPDKDLAATIGRADAASKPPPAKLNFWMKNVGGKYTKGNPMSPYWPYIRKNTPCRVTLNPNTGSVRQYTMYVTQWLPRWGTSGNSGRQPLVQVVANGVRRRLTQGSSSLRSALYRKVAAGAALAAWSLEDGSAATTAAPTTAGAVPLIPFGSVPADIGSITPLFGKIDGPAGSAQLPDFSSKGSLQGPVPTYADTGQWQVEVWFKTLEGDSSKFSAVVPIQWDLIGGTYPAMDVLLFIGQGANGNGLGTIGFDISPYMASPPAEINRAGSSGIPPDGPFLIVGSLPNVQGSWRQLRVCMRQVVAGTVELSAYLDNVRIGLATATSATLGRLGRFVINPTQGVGAYAGVAGTGISSLGHVEFYNTIADPGTYSAGIGYAGEPAADRMVRLCGEEGVPIVVSGASTTVAEGFETATPAVTITGTWARNSTQFHSGGWSLKSATIGNSASTDAVVTAPDGATSLTFWYKVSSESGFDFFQILRDGVQESQFSGEVGWTQRTIDVTGVKQVTFRYAKDPATVAGSDAVWIDDLAFMVPTTARMGPQRPESLVALLDECQEVDGGILLDGINPGWTYLPRVNAYNLPVALTIDMAGRQFKAPFEPRDDDAGVVNDQTVTRVDGLFARFIDKDGPAGTDAIQRYDDSKTINVEKDTDLAAQAAWRTHIGTAGADALRFPGIGFNLHELGGSALIEPWLQAGVRKRVQATHPPAEYGPGLIDLLVEGYIETVRSRRVWSVAANTSPYVHDVAVVGQSRVDSANTTVRTTVPAGAASVQVNVGTVQWTTNPAKLPAGGLDMNIDGIRVRVTAISGAGPQTLTVDPATVVKPLIAGRPVRIWTPAVVAL